MITNISAVTVHLESFVKSYTDYAVVGISGGVDSAVVASVCVSALGPQNVYLMSMPYGDLDTSSFNARSGDLAAQLGAIHHTTHIGAATDSLANSLQEAFPEWKLNKLTHANIRPRIRMAVLYGISGELGYRTGKRARVMGTGHMSEDLIGYDTKGGDALCDVFILSDFVKSEVYQLADYYDVPMSIRQAVPSAGLYEGQTDEQELGFAYADLEPATLGVFKALQRGIARDDLSVELPEFAGLEELHVNFVIKRYQMHHHKHEAPLNLAMRRAEWFSE